MSSRRRPRSTRGGGGGSRRGGGDGLGGGGSSANDLYSDWDSGAGSEDDAYDEVRIGGGGHSLVGGRQLGGSRSRSLGSGGFDSDGRGGGEKGRKALAVSALGGSETELGSEVGVTVPGTPMRTPAAAGALEVPGWRIP